MPQLVERSSARERIDNVLVSRGLVESRSKARALLMAGQVRVQGRKVTTPAERVTPSSLIEIESGPKYVSRGGDKLEGALAAFRLDVDGLTCVDVGASTGGFTDCLLQHGARRVYAVDVGYGELAYKLRNDDRVVVMERTNARDLAPLPEECDLATVDVSFIGLEKVLPAVIRSLKPTGQLVVLVKPQFQARHEEVGKKGVVRDPQVHAAVLGRVVAWAVQNGLRLRGLTTSPLLGPAGNMEFFLHLTLVADEKARP